ncbi:protein phosphatase [Phlyctema vagabunda]|uniref:Protein phosphatase n=1 Tax=Phlyctema vagabunda TaxID=108571 RepID=A0ABR4PME1_9HELO
MYHKSDANTSRGPTALLRALESTGRSRGSSATPPLESPTPKKNLGRQESSGLEGGSTPPSGSLRQTQNRPSGGSQQLPSETVLTRPQGLPRSQGTFSPPRQFPPQGNPSSSDQGFSAQPTKGNNMYGLPNQFQPPSTTRQGTAQRLAPTAPAVNTAMFTSANAQIMPPVGSWQGQLGAPSSDPLSLLSTEIRQRIFDLEGDINSATEIPRALQHHISQELHQIGDRFHDCQRRYAQQISQLNTDCATFKGQLAQLQSDLARASHRGDHNEEMREALELEKSKIRLRHEKSMERLRDLNESAEQEKARLQSRLQETERELEIRQQQVESKRSIWYETQSAQSARRVAQNSAGPDVFTSPPKADTSEVASQNLSSTSHHALPSMRPLSKPQLPNRANDLEPEASARESRLVNSGTSEQKITQSMALIVHQRDDETFDMFGRSMGKVFGLIAGWVNTFTNIPNPDSDKQLSTNETLWKYMLGLAYPNHIMESEVHVMSLLNSKQHRHWFAMRMLTEYVVKDILNVALFQSYSTEVSKTIEDVKKSLEKRGLNNAVRQSLMYKQAAAVRSVVDSDAYEDWRYKELARHSGKLRKMFGPLLNADIVRADAGTDLGLIVAFTLDLSAKMNTSDYSFKYIFPPTSANFQPSTMVVKDFPGHDPSRLQIQQVRVRLSMTPSITIRDDRTASIITKTLHKASVLVM